MYEVSKIEAGGVELLPDIVDTPIWKDYDEIKCKKGAKFAAILYNAVRDRENYYQENTPTAFGDPKYSRQCGFVAGILQGAGLEEKSDGGKITFMKNGKPFLVVDKISRTDAYYDAVRDNGETLRGLGL